MYLRVPNEHGHVDDTRQEGQSVPVLSEHRTRMEAISCRAVRWVTIAFLSAIVFAPIAIVT